MKIKNKYIWIVSISLVLLLITMGLIWSRDALALDDSPGQHLSPGFTYQGYLEEGGKPVEGEYNFSFEIFDAEADGDSLGYLEVGSVKISGGHFTVLLEFDSEIFFGEDRWLEIGIDPKGDGEFLILDRRQKLTPAPYSWYAVQAGGVDWWNISYRPAGLDNGDQDTTYIAGFGLDLTGTTFDVDTDTVQSRVYGSCKVGSTIRAIDADGTVECQEDATTNRILTPSETLSTTLGIGKYPSITIGSDGLPVMSYTDSNSDLMLAHCDDPLCSNATVTAVDSHGIFGEYSAITIGADGFPVISYFDGDNLKIAICHDQTCTNVSTNQVDSGIGISGSYLLNTSITIGSDGLPIIAYPSSDSADADVLVVHCDSPNCDTFTQNRVIDGGIFFPPFPSITTGSDGLPIISSYIGIAHCDDHACNSAFLNTTSNPGYPIDGYRTSIPIVIGEDGLPMIVFLMDMDIDLILFVALTVDVVILADTL